MKLDYESLYKNKLNENISKIRSEIETPGMVKKIQNFSQKFNVSVDEIKQKILNDEMFSYFFIKEPKKQNIYEKAASDYIKNINGVTEFENYPSNIKMFVVNGELTTQRVSGVKSIDFKFKVKNTIFYVSHKYIKDRGGAQDNQYNDIRNFLKNCVGNEIENVVFIAICDGEYFSDKIISLKDEFNRENIYVVNINSLNEIIKKYDE